MIDARLSYWNADDKARLYNGLPKEEKRQQSWPTPKAPRRIRPEVAW